MYKEAYKNISDLFFVRIDMAKLSADLHEGLTIKATKPKDKENVLRDGNGLFLLIPILMAENTFTFILHCAQSLKSIVMCFKFIAISKLKKNTHRK